jgi:ABC-type oligopeptide transport system substrate-binding subunit
MKITRSYNRKIQLEQYKDFVEAGCVVEMETSLDKFKDDSAALEVFARTETHKTLDMMVRAKEKDKNKKNRTIEKKETIKTDTILDDAEVEYDTAPH